MKRKTYILLLIALMIGGRGMAERIETVDGFQTCDVVSTYQNQQARVYSGGQTTWSVINGGVTSIKAVAESFGGVSGYQKAVALQYNGSSPSQKGTMTSGYIKGLKELAFKGAATKSNMQGQWTYSTDSIYWRNITQYNRFDVTGVDSETIINLPTEVTTAKGVYLRYQVTSSPDKATGSSYRLYVDDIRIVTEVEDECGNCFPITL